MTITEQIVEVVKEHGPITRMGIANKLGHVKYSTIDSTVIRLEKAGRFKSGKIKNKGKAVKYFVINRDYPTVPPKTTPFAVEGHRRCSKCGEYKTFSEFHKNNAGTRGINNTCKPCMVIKAGERDLSIARLDEWWASDKRQYEVQEGLLDTPCHVWTRALSGSTGRGYPQAGIDYHVVRVHRLALVKKLRRHINPGMTASHLCHESRCINPEHIVEESMQDNRARGDRRSLMYYMGVAA